MAATLVKRFVYPIKTMKRPFISALSGRVLTGLYLDKLPKHEAAPCKEVHRQKAHPGERYTKYTQESAHKHDFSLLILYLANISQ